MRNANATIFILVGATLGLVAGRVSAPATRAKADPRIETRLYRFELNKNELATFDRWVQFEHDHHKETVTTLERERMYFEGIFRDRQRDSNVIYWLAVRGIGGAASDSSPLPIDKQYQEFMQRTLVKGSRQELDLEYFLISEFLEKAIQVHRASEKGS